ncbi:MAG: lipid-transfer protein [Burkholderiales bacterium]
MSRAVFVAGVGTVPSVKRGAGESYPLLGARAAKAALADAGIGYQAVEQVVAGFVYGDSCSGQAAVYHLGLTGIPVINVNNNCASGSTALYLARQAVAGGAAECVLALGFEQVQPGDGRTSHYTDRPAPVQRQIDAMQLVQGVDTDTAAAVQLFGGAGQMHTQLYGTRPATFARIAVKARLHAQHRPQALFRDLLSLDEVQASPMLFDPLTRLQCCVPVCGAAAAVVCSADFARRHGLEGAVCIAAQALVTDGNSSFDEHDMRKLVGFDMSRRAAQQVFAAAGVGPEDITVAEVHDSFTVSELLAYEALGFAAEGGAEQFILDGHNTYGGRVVVNPSGGMLANGHPYGAAGLAQCAELVQQLRGRAGPGQVPDARFGLQHNLGIGGACVVTLYSRT